MNIQYLTPYTLDKNIGKAYNEAIADTSSAWVCLRDGDACFLTPNWGQVLAEAAASDLADAYGCLTNRLGVKELTVETMFDEHDMRVHYAQSEDINRRSLYVQPVDLIAGHCMLIRRDVWEQIKFAENTPCFDIIFCREAKAAGYRIGLIHNLYQYHAYRLWVPSDREKARNSAEHLFL